MEITAKNLGHKVFVFGGKIVNNTFVVEHEPTSRPIYPDATFADQIRAELKKAGISSNSFADFEWADTTQTHESAAFVVNDSFTSEWKNASFSLAF